MSEAFAKITRWAAPAAFLALGSLWIDLPGPGPDEALFAQAIFPVPPGGPAWKLQLPGADIPVMLMPYLGVLKAWLYVPLTAVFGTSPAALRLPMLALGALTILLFFELTMRWAGTRAATVTAWLLATDPTFFWTTRCDWGPTVLQRLLSVAGCALVWRGSQSGSLRRIFAGFFLFGLGLFDKLTFHWLLVGYAVATAVMFGPEAFRSVRPAAFGVALAGLALGASPYLAYRLQSAAESPDLSFETDAARYRQKGWMLLKTLDGTVARGFMTSHSAPAPAPSRGPADDALEAVFGPELKAGTAGGMLPWTVAAAVFLIPWTKDPATRFAAVFCVAALAAMAPIRDAASVHHQALLLPFPQLFVGGTLAWYAARGGWRCRVALIAGSFVLAFNLITLGSLYRDALRLGGSPDWSEAAYALAEDLRARRPRLAVALDWGIDNPQRFLLAHDPPVQPLAFPWDWADRGTVDRLEQEIRQGGVVFLARADPATRLYPETRENATQAAERAGARLTLARTIADRQGRPVFEVLETQFAPEMQQNR